MTGNTGTTPIAAAINRFYFVLDTDSLYPRKNLFLSDRY